MHQDGQGPVLEPADDVPDLPAPVLRDGCARPDEWVDVEDIGVDEHGNAERCDATSQVPHPACDDPLAGADLRDPDSRLYRGRFGRTLRHRQLGHGVQNHRGIGNGPIFQAIDSRVVVCVPVRLQPRSRAGMRRSPRRSVPGPEGLPELSDTQGGSPIVGGVRRVCVSAPTVPFRGSVSTGSGESATG
jgi:hypothetical protein